MKKYLWVGALLLAWPTVARADGMVVPRPMRTVTETAQKAVIWYEDGLETMILSTNFQGDPEEFAWIVPVPGKPEVDRAKDEIFGAIQEYTLPQYPDRVPLPLFGATNQMLQQQAVQPSVVVGETKKVDIYDVVVLDANDAGALSEWLSENGFEYPRNRDNLLRYYIEKHWYFVAAKVSADNMGYAVQAMAVGHAAPLRLTFSSPTIIYPLKISGQGSRLARDKAFAESFEHGLSGWMNRGKVTVDGKDHMTSIGWSADWSQDGKYSLRVTDGLGPPDYDYAYYQLSGLQAGKQYVFSAYAHLKKATKATAMLRVSEGGPYIALSDETGFGAGTLTKRLSTTFMSSGGTAKLELLAHNLALNEGMYWDQVQVEEGAEATDWSGEVMPARPETNGANSSVAVMLYVFTKHKQYLPGFKTEYAGEVQEKQIEMMSVSDDGSPWIDARRPMYLTKLTRYVPTSEMTDDLVLRDATDDTAVGGVSRVWGGNWRPWLVFGGLGGLELLALGYYWYSRNRKVKEKEW